MCKFDEMCFCVYTLGNKTCVTCAARLNSPDHKNVGKYTPASYTTHDQWKENHGYF